MTHGPKMTALVAYEDGVLSAEGRRRMERHLRNCEACRRALAAMRLYDDVLDEVRSAPPPQPDWSHMELALRRIAKAQSRAIRSRRGVSWAMAGGLAAAAALALVMVSRQPRIAPSADLVTHGRSHPGRTLTSRQSIRGEITATSGTVTDTTWPREERVLTVGEAVTEGMSLEVGRGSEGHIRFYDGTGVVLVSRTRVRISELREHRVALVLEHGTVSSAVAHLEEGDRYEVRADGWTVSVRGTRFAVRHRDRALSVALAEGVVDISYLGRLQRHLEAPSTWSSDGGRPLALASVLEPDALEPDGPTWPSLRLPAMAQVDRWQVGDQRVAGGGELTMRAPPGDVTVTGYAGGQVVLRTVVALLPGGTSLRPAELTPHAPPVREGHLAPQLIAPTVRAGMRRMQGCQERVARTGPDVFGRFTLRITIGRTGEVLQARLLPRSGTVAPPAFAVCVLQEARSWHFPPPTGGIVRFEQPLTFATRAP